MGCREVEGRSMVMAMAMLYFQGSPSFSCLDTFQEGLAQLSQDRDQGTGTFVSHGSPDTAYISPDSLDLIPSWSMGWLDSE